MLFRLKSPHVFEGCFLFNRITRVDKQRVHASLPPPSVTSILDSSPKLEYNKCGRTPRAGRTLPSKKSRYIFFMALRHYPTYRITLVAMRIRNSILRLGVRLGVRLAARFGSKA